MASKLHRLRNTDSSYFGKSPKLMSLLVLHSIKSEDEREAQAISEAVFRPSELTRFHANGAFDIKADIATIRNMTLWQSTTRSGYRVRYGCPKQQQVELHFIETGKFEFQYADGGIEALAQTAVLLKDTRKVAMTATPGSSKLSVLIPFDHVAQHINRSNRSSGRGLTAFHTHIDTKVSGIDLLQKIASHLLHGIDQNSRAAEAVDSPVLIRDALIMMFVSLWPRTETLPDGSSTLPRHLERALNWLEHHTEEDISVDELARLSGASIRTLQNSFRHHLSTTPKAYALRLRLSRVHEELLHGPGSDSIEAIASRWGFGHMGYFAARYRALYGKAPSDTRKGRVDLK